MKIIRRIVSYTAPPTACLAAAAGVFAALNGDVNLIIVFGLLAVALLATDIWLGRG